MYNVIIVCLKYFDAVFWRQEGYMAYKNFYFKTSCEAINVSGCDIAQSTLRATELAYFKGILACSVRMLRIRMTGY